MSPRPSQRLLGMPKSDSKVMRLVPHEGRKNVFMYFEPPRHARPMHTADVHMMDTEVANPFPPYSLQKRPKPQICPKFVPAIVLGGSSQGGLRFGKICQYLKNGNFRSNFDKFFQISVPLTGTPQNNRWDKSWTNLGFRVFLKAVRGKRVRNTEANTTWVDVMVTAAQPGRPITDSLREAEAPKCREYGLGVPNTAVLHQGLVPFVIEQHGHPAPCAQAAPKYHTKGC